jgi:Family of unknown function (DUF6178)
MRDLDPNVLPREASSLVTLSGRDQARALALFNGLDPARQVALVKNAAPEDKKELLFLAKDLPTLLDSLPGRDVYLALEAATASEFDVLVGRIGPEHLNFLLAMGCWRDGAIDDARVLHWLDIINNADDGAAAGAISGIEADFLAAALWPHIDVSSAEDDADDGVRWRTPDHCRFDNDTVEDFMVRLYAVDRTLFELVCHKRAMADVDEIFESARLAYSRRLEKEGLPSYEEAVAVYEKGWTIVQSARLTTRSGAVVDKDGPVDPFLTLAMHSLDARGTDKSRVAADFSTLLSKIAVADGGEMDAAARKRVVRKAELFAGLGLERMSGGDAAAAADMLAKNGVTPFFKVGYDMVSRLREKANAVLGTPLDNSENAIAPAAALSDRAVLKSAAREMPCIVLENGKARTVRNLAEFTILEEIVRQVEREQSGLQSG